MADPMLLALEAGVNVPQPGPDLAKLMTMQQLQARLQQLQQVQQAKNAMQQFYRNPANMGPNGVPTQPAMNQLMAQNVDAGMDVQEYVTKQADHREKLTLDHQKSVLGQNDLLLDINRNALAVYNQAYAANNPRAMDMARETQMKAIREAKDSGALGPNVQPPPFSPQLVDAQERAQLTLKDRIAIADRAANREREGWSPLIDYGHSPPVQYWAKHGETPQSLTGEPYTPTGVAKDIGKWQVLTDPNNKDEKGEPIQYRYNPDTGEATTLDMKPYTPKGAARMGAAPSSGTQFSESDIDYWANVLKNGGALPPGIARGTSGAELVKKIMQKMAVGGDPNSFTANRATVRADTTSLVNMTKMADAATSFEKTAERNFDLAMNFVKGDPENKLPPGNPARGQSPVVPTDWGPWLNRWVMDGEKMFGDTEVPAYVTAMLTGANEYAKIMSGSTGAQGSTVDSRREAAELFSPYLSKGQIERVIAVAKADMGNREATLYGQVDDIKRRLHEAGTTAPTAPPGGPAAPPAGATPSATPPAGVAPATPTRPTQQGIPEPKSDAEYDALPPGSPYLYQGKVLRKP